MILGYIDPGTGSVMLQLLTGGIIGALFIAKSCWLRLKAFSVKVLHAINHRHKE